MNKLILIISILLVLGAFLIIHSLSNQGKRAIKSYNNHYEAIINQAY